MVEIFSLPAAGQQLGASPELDKCVHNNNNMEMEANAQFATILIKEERNILITCVAAISTERERDSGPEGRAVDL